MAAMIDQTPIMSPSTSARRKRGQTINSRINTGNINSLNINDDEQERRQRKRSLLLSNNLLSPIAGHSTPRRSRAGSLTSDLDPERTHIGMTYAQLKEHNANCVKLSSENKINSKNAFALHLIDYMKVLVTQSQKEDSTTNFQVASCTLDAGVKIYAGRVDSVHADAYKMLGSLGRATEMPSGEEDNIADPDGTQQNKQQKKKKTNRGPGKTIEKNVKSLNCDKFDMTFEVDPFFHKTSASFDEGGTRGLLLNNLLITDESYQLMLDSRKEMKSSEEGSINTDSRPMPIKLAPFKDISTKLFDDEIELCPQFVNFRFTEWDRNAEDLISGQSQKSFVENQDHRFDMDASAMEVDCEAGDNDGGDVSDFEAGGFGNDEPFGDNFIETAAVTDDREAVMAADHIYRPGVLAGGGTFGPLQLEFSLQPTEYSYFRQDILDKWAGPHHWKLKARSKDPTRNGTEAADANKKKRQKKTPFKFDYESDTNIQDISNPGKVAKTLAKSTLDKMSTLLTTLYDELHYDPERFPRLFTKPSVRMTRQFRPEGTQDNDCYNYNYDNEYDRENFCPEMGNDDDDDDDDDAPGGHDMSYGDFMGNATHRGFDETTGEQTFFGGENLVSQPNKVEKIQISYAKTAKRIDIGRLKKVMWESLTVAENNNDKENLEIPKDTEHRPLVKQLEDRNMTEEQSFKNIYNNLPNKISQNASKNLSVPIAFVCMLYLANEKELKLTGCEDMSDLKIAKEHKRTEE